ncbi:MAG: hypothetical protein ACKPEO_21725, partial [Sphaerospermopsis kisseleviana]
KQRIFLVDRRLYQVSAETTTKMQKFLTKSISGFCDSLKLLSCYTAKLYNPNILNFCGTGKMPVPLIQIKCTTA